MQQSGSSTKTSLLAPPSKLPFSTSSSSSNVSLLAKPSLLSSKLLDPTPIASVTAQSAPALHSKLPVASKLAAATSFGYKSAIHTPTVHATAIPAFVQAPIVAAVATTPVAALAKPLPVASSSSSSSSIARSAIPLPPSTTSAAATLPLPSIFAENGKTSSLRLPSCFDAPLYEPIDSPSAEVAQVESNVKHDEEEGMTHATSNMNEEESVMMNESVTASRSLSASPPLPLDSERPHEQVDEEEDFSCTLAANPTRARAAAEDGEEAEESDSFPSSDDGFGSFVIPESAEVSAANFSVASSSFDGVSGTEPETRENYAPFAFKIKPSTPSLLARIDFHALQLECDLRDATDSSLLERKVLQVQAAESKRNDLQRRIDQYTETFVQIMDKCEAENMSKRKTEGEQEEVQEFIRRIRGIIEGEQ